MTSNNAKQLDERIAARLGRLRSGAYAHELWRSLSDSGLSVHRDDVAKRLLSLQRIGRARLEGRQWLAGSPAPDQPTADAAEGSPALEAIPVAIQVAAAARETGVAVESGAIEPSWPMLRELALHYAECLRLAGASRLTQVVERHGSQFVMLAPDRPSWWPAPSSGVRLRISTVDAPPQLLEAFYNRRGYPAFLGYPLSCVRTTEGQVFLRPIAVIECIWRVEDNGVVLEPRSPVPLLNPDWLSGLKRNRRMAQVMAWLGSTQDSADDGLSSIRTGDWDDVPELAQTLGVFLASELTGTLDPFRVARRLAPGPGVHNALTLFLPDVNRYTGRARGDLVRLAEFADAELAQTTLAPLLGIGAGKPDGVPVLPPLSLGEDQLVAARDGLAGPLTVVSGPPGTGKSQVVAAIMASAAFAGRTVLFASRTHQALDAVELRLRELLPERVIFARAKAPEREREFDFAHAVDALLARPQEPDAAAQLAARVLQLAAGESRLWSTVAAADALEEATRTLASLEAELDALATAPPTRGDDVAKRFLPRLLAWVRGFLGLTAEGAPPAEKSAERLRRQLASAEDTHRRLAKALEQAQRANPLDATLETLRRDVAASLEVLANALETVSAEERPRLSALAGDLGLATGADEILRLWRDNADLVLRHFPLWASTTLSAGGRIPLLPGLFDYVIFDEAATCDLGSALPLLARARRAIIVGDKMQTGLVVDLEPKRELELLERAGLRRPGIGRFAFTQASLFDLASASPFACRHILRDHYRCGAEIADYISETFYGRRLNILTDESRLHPPKGSRPGIHWTHVEGAIERAGSGCIAPAEAEAVAAHLEQLLETEGYDGTVGVVTPFARQAEQIIRVCESRLSRAAIDRTQLRIATGHSFQGDARDVVLISPCYGPDTPQGSQWFLRDQVELFNVAVSRARAVCHVFGNLDAARRSSIPHLAKLAKRIGRSESQPDTGEDRFESPWEKRLYDALVACGLRPLPQYPLAGRRLDLALVSGETRLDVEVDGDAWHRDPDGFRKVSDLWRDHVVRSLGWKVLRFWVYELRTDMGGCVERVRHELG